MAEFDRQDLRTEDIFVEIDFPSIDPRSFLRNLIRSIQSVESEDGFKYKTNTDADLYIDEEGIGNRSGYFSWGLTAATTWNHFHTKEVTSGQGNSTGAGIFALIGVLLIFGAAAAPSSAQGVLLLFGILLVIIGILMFLQKKSEDVEYSFRKRTRILLQGEATEYVTDGSTEIRSDLNLAIGEGIEVKSSDRSATVSMTNLDSEIRDKLDQTIVPITTEIGGNALSGGTVYTGQLDSE